jgi:pimeloyl-ACP methyl ester carboxylesterase
MTLQDELQDEFIDIGRGRLYVSHAGSGHPVAILESGLGSASDTWELVQPAIAQFTRVWSYDRAGLGKSDPAPVPRTCQDMVNDLHAMLTSANVTPPYVLVGHSFGGLVVRLFAAQYPDKIAGMVLVDASHEDRYIHFEEVFSESQIARSRAYLNDPSRNSEHLNVIASNSQVRSARSAFNFPLFVLARGQPDELSSIWPSESLQNIEVNLQRELTNISTRGTFILAEKSGHFIQLDQPELVVESVHQVVEMARRDLQ